MSILVFFFSKPTTLFAGNNLPENFMWNLYNKKCRVCRMHSNNKNILCHTCLKYRHTTNMCISNTKAIQCRFCRDNHFYSNHQCTALTCFKRPVLPQHQSIHPMQQQWGPLFIGLKILCLVQTEPCVLKRHSLKWKPLIV